MTSKVPGKRVLAVNRRPPYGTSHAAELLELVLMIGAFDQKVSILFIDDGIYQLMRNQNPQVLGQQKLSSAFNVLSQYGVDNVLVDGESLHSRNVKADDLDIPVTIISTNELADLFLSQDVLIEA